MSRIGLLPLGRPTFDVAFAEEKLAGMLSALDASGHEIVGPQSLLFDADATKAAFRELQSAEPDLLLILQVTFTDASMTIAAANAFPTTPLAIWAVPEPRLGGRLRLNAFCGLNLASHALGLSGRRFGWLYADPPSQDDLALLLSGGRQAGELVPVAAPNTAHPDGQAAVARVRGSKIARVGAHPDGFDTCAYDDAVLAELADVTVHPFELSDLFARAKTVTPARTAEVRALADTTLTGLDDVNAEELDRSLRLKVALDDLRAEGGFSAFALRCWPETFTEYGGAICGPVSMMGEAKIPCACEADVYGALSQMILQEASGAPIFLVDLVDMDVEDNSGVVWHCGQAPISMRDPNVTATATIHTNRKMPLLYEFPLKPGRATLMRVSQAHGKPRMVLAGAEVLERDMAFTGTSGVVRFDRSAAEVLPDIIDSGLEHHMALVYGEHRPVLRAMAAELGLPLLEL